MNNKYRTEYCGNVNDTLVDKNIVLSGWVENIRDHGGVIFVDLRDIKGTVQLVSNDDNIFTGLSKESTITVKGIVRKRKEEDYNDKINTGTLRIPFSLAKSSHSSTSYLTTSNPVSCFKVLSRSLQGWHHELPYFSILVIIMW